MDLPAEVLRKLEIMNTPVDERAERRAVDERARAARDYRRDTQILRPGDNLSVLAFRQQVEARLVERIGAGLDELGVPDLTLRLAWGQGASAADFARLVVDMILAAAREMLARE